MRSEIDYERAAAEFVKTPARVMWIKEMYWFSVTLVCKKISTQA